MTTASDLVNRTRGLVTGSMSETLNVLGKDYAPGDGRLSLKVPTPLISGGMLLSAGLNVFYVANTSETTGTLEVLASPNGEPDLPLTAGTILRVKPRFTDWLIFCSVNEQIDMMSSPANGLYTTATWTDRVDPAWNTYQVPEAYLGMIDLMRVRHKVVGSPDQWTDLRQWSIQHNSEGGSVIRIFQRDIQFGDLEFVAKMPMKRAATLDSNIETDCLLSPTMVDIPVLGSAGWLMLGAEGQRVHQRATGEGRRPDEVSVGASGNLGQSLLRQRDKRIDEEMARLLSRHTYVMGRW